MSNLNQYATQSACDRNRGHPVAWRDCSLGQTACTDQRLVHYTILSCCRPLSTWRQLKPNLMTITISFNIKWSKSGSQVKAETLVGPGPYNVDGMLMSQHIS